MIDLYTIKVQNSYTYLKQADIVSATEGETLLANVTDANYKRGYSYTYTSSVWVRQESDKDAKIDVNLLPTISNTLKWLNNYFYVKSEGDFPETQNFDTTCGCVSNPYVYLSDDSAVYNADGKIETTETTVFILNDLVHIQSSERNKDKVGYVSVVVADTSFTLDRTLVAGTGYGTFYLSQIPEDVELVISKMIWYDVYQRDLAQEGAISSESEGTYSVSYDETNPISGILYPKGILNGLMQYKIARFMN